MVHAGGRPRTVSLEPADMEILGEEMVQWVIDNKPLHISEWYGITKRIQYSDWETMRKRPEFVTYYEIAMQIIGKQYLDKNSNVREGASQRWQRVYFKDLAKEEDDKADRLIDKDTEAKIKVLDHAAALKAKETEIISEDMHAKFDALIDQLKPQKT